MHKLFLLVTDFFLSFAITSLHLAADAVKLGFVMPFSGWFPPIGATTINGTERAIKETNAKDAVLGKQIESMDFDTKPEPALSTDGALEVTGKGAKATSAFDFGAPGAFIAQQKDVLAFGDAANPRFRAKGIGNLAYTMTNAPVAQADDPGFRDTGYRRICQ